MYDLTASAIATGMVAAPTILNRSRNARIPVKADLAKFDYKINTNEDRGEPREERSIH